MVAPGGRCYTKTQTKLDLEKQVRCPVCQKWTNIDSYESHFEIHR